MISDGSQDDLSYLIIDQWSLSITVGTIAAQSALIKEVSLFQRYSLVEECCCWDRERGVIISEVVYDYLTIIIWTCSNVPFSAAMALSCSIYAPLTIFSPK